MVPPWLAENPRVGPGLAFGREQRFVVDPDGILGLCDMLTECPRHQPTPLYALPALAARLGLGEIRVKDESQRFGFGAFKALGGVLAVYNELAGAVGAARGAGAAREATRSSPPIAPAPAVAPRGNAISRPLGVKQNTWS